jgi:hypothetical protein
MPVDNTPHEHIWVTRSSHTTSDGLLRYQGCACGCWQIVIAPTAEPLPAIATATGRRQRGGAA